MRRHGFQPPLHPLQLIGIAVYCVLLLFFYVFLGFSLGSRCAEITVITMFSFVAVAVMFLFVRCTATDPTDRTSSRNRKKKKNAKKFKSKALSKFNFGFIVGQIVLRFLCRIERKILRTFIRRKYLDPMTIDSQMEPLLPFPLIVNDDAFAPDQNEFDITFCAFCDLEVQKHSKHCRTCNRCVEGFDHHCRLTMEGVTAIVVFIRCFTDKRGIETELRSKIHVKFPREALATISVLVVLITGYGAAALAQLFFFHIVLIRKGMRTYDYILAMKEESRSIELDAFDGDFSSDLSSSDESTDCENSPKKLNETFQSHGKLCVRIDKKLSSISTSSKKEGLRVSIDPWKLIKLSRDKALAAAHRARERLAKQPLKQPGDRGDTPETDSPVVSSSPAGFSSPRRRFSGLVTAAAAAASSPKQKYRSNFDLKLTEVSMELESYISRQVLSSVLKNESSPR